MTSSHEDHDRLENLPNEIVGMILARLPRRHLKQARLVCKRLAELGMHQLIDTVYFSPREKDMVVFDAVTQHPVLAKNIKKLVFDNAQFDILSMNDYFNHLCRQLSQPQTFRLMLKIPSVDKLVRLIREISPGSFFSYLPIQATASAFERCQRDVVFLEGYREYSAHVEEQEKIMDDTWFTRVLDGLHRLGSIDTVVLDSTFNRTFFIDDRDFQYDETESNDEEIDKGTASDIHLALAHFEGKSVTGSPIARRWPATALVPLHPWYHHREPDLPVLRNPETPSGRVELLRLTQLLRAASKQPFGLSAEGGVSPCAFASNSLPEPIHLHEISQRLKILHIRIDFYDRALGPVTDTDRWHPELHTFKTLMRNLPTLEFLQLLLPFGDIQFGPPIYDFSQLFPPVTEWRLPKLQSLILMGLSFSYKELAGFFFLVLPQLESMLLGDLLLKDGAWDDFVEWYRQHRAPLVFLLDRNLLYPEGRDYYWRSEKWSEDDGKLPDFMELVATYIVDGGRHPGLRNGECNSDSVKYLTKMGATIEELRAASTCD
ncbi:MAG: hypothetical protein LQ337_007637 [Flavoplaca oasis]|nr:MAG: hypothetical protein LQ337_007637 [Flavoplaca oasis]